MLGFFAEKAKEEVLKEIETTFGINPSDHSAKENLVKALDAAVAGLKTLEGVAGRFSQTDYQRGFAYLNNMAGKKLSDNEVNEAAAVVAAVGPALKVLEGFLTKAETSIAK